MSSCPLPTKARVRCRRLSHHIVTVVGLAIAAVCVLWGEAGLAHGAVPARFVRTPALSPDASQIAFGWRGDLWSVATQGGRARRLTAHEGHDMMPLWSPDGRKLAFASRRHGNFDIYVMDASGGVPKRLTFHSAHDYPVDWSSDGKSILFRSRRHRVHTLRTPLYRVSIHGGMPRRILNVSLADGSISADGNQMVFSRGSSRWWRKRWKGPFHSRLWRYDRKQNRFFQLTPQGYTASNPTWINPREIVYRSEKSGSIELWKMDITTKQQTQLTSFATDKSHPHTWAAVRFPRASRNGSAVVFTRWDRMYTYHLKTKALREVVATVSADLRQNVITRQVKRRGITEYKISPSGAEIAFVVRGDIFIKLRNDPYAWARRIGSSYWRERQLSWSHDGRKLAFVSDRNNGRNAVYILEAPPQNGVRYPMTRTYKLKLKRLTAPNAKVPEQRPLFSPKGDKLLLQRGRGTLVLHDLAKGTQRVLLRGWNLEHFSWSPDGRWIVLVRSNHHSNSDIFLLKLNGTSRIFNLSRYPDNDTSPVWSANGRVLAFLSRDVHNRNKIQFVYLRKRDHERSRSEIERDCGKWAKKWRRHVRRAKKARARQRKVTRRGKTRRGKTRQRRPKARKRRHPTSRPASRASRKRRKARDPFRVRVTALARLPFRQRSVPFVPGFQGARHLAISPTGCHFYISVRGRGIRGLYRIRFDGRKLKRIAKGKISQLTVTHDNELLYLLKGGKLYAKHPKKKRAKPFKFKAEQWVHRLISYRQKFEEGWGLLNEWFYDPRFHGVDWNKMHTRYAKLVQHARNDIDFDEAVRMMLGELNASHLGIYSIYKGPKDRTADLGLTFDLSHKGRGLKIASVRKRGPAYRHRSRLKPGDVILSLNGQPLSSKINLHALLNHKAERYILLNVARGKQRLRLPLRPVSPRRARLQRYLTWVDSRRALVKKWSGGMLSYAHIRSMNMSSLVRFERALFAYTHGTQGLVIDVRNNGGGWTADLLLTMFLPKAHAFTRWRGSKKGYPAVRKPFYSWHKPTILLANERSVSNAEIFAHAYKNLKLGTLVGMPTYGGVISTKTIRILDGTWFRIPLRGWWAIPTNANMENGPAEPHVVVPHNPKDEQTGNDPQLYKAVRLQLTQLAKRTKKPTKRTQKPTPRRK